jgi:hypothetical protein
MKALEFQTSLNPDGTIRLPEGLSAQVPGGTTVRVIVLIDEPSDEDREWAEMSAAEIAKEYGDDDAAYDHLPPG